MAESWWENLSDMVGNAGGGLVDYAVRYWWVTILVPLALIVYAVLHYGFGVV